MCNPFILSVGWQCTLACSKSQHYYHDNICCPNGTLNWTLSSSCDLSNGRCRILERPPCLPILCSMIGSCQTNIKWNDIRFNCAKFKVQLHLKCTSSSTLTLLTLILVTEEANAGWMLVYMTIIIRKSLTVKRFLESTSIIPRSRFWQSGGTKCGMWNTPRFTFSSSWRRLSSSNGKAPWSAQRPKYL